MIGSGPPLGQIGGTYRGSFRVKSPTGVLVNADSLPTGVLVVNGVDTGVTVTITNLATGRYAVSCSLAGRSLLDVCWVRINATAGGVADEDALPAFVVALDAAGLLKVDVEDFGGVGADPSQLWDVLQGTQTLDVNAALIGGSDVTANAGTNLSTFFDVNTPLFNALGITVMNLDASVAGVLTAVQNVQNNTFVGTNVPAVLERPDSGSATFTVVVLFNDATGSPHDVDASASPTVALTNDAGTSLASRLSAWTKTATGKYTATYTSSAADAIEGVHWDVSGTVNGKLRRWVGTTQVVDTTAVDFTSSDRTALNNLTTAVASLPASVWANGTRTLTDFGFATGLSTFDPSTQFVRLAATQPNYAPLKSSDYAAPPTAQQNADALLATTNGDDTVADQLKHLDRDVSSVSGGSSGGDAGAFTIAVTVTDGTNPIPGATVRYSQAGITRWSGPTDGSGVANVSVDAGTFSRTVTAGAYNGVTTTGLEVDADGTATVVLTRISVTASDVGFCTLYADAYDKDNRPVAGVDVTIRLVDGGGVAGRSFPKGAEVTATSADGNGGLPLGRVEFTGRLRGGTYQVRRGSGAWVEFVVDDADAMAIDEFLGGADD